MPKMINMKRTGLTLLALILPENASTLMPTLAALSRRSVVQWIAGTSLALPLAGEVYARFGPSIDEAKSVFSEDLPKNWELIDDVTIVFHGAGGQDLYTDELMSRLKAGRKDNSFVAMIDWSDLSKDLLQASFNGQRLGRCVASELIQRSKANISPSNLKNVHVIGISVGAFAADSFVTKLKEEMNKGNNKLFAQLTLLDPFSQRGVLGYNYGNKMFGASANYAQQFLNTDDPVPSTNTPLSRCVCIDVTSLRPENIFGHDWPLVYFSRSDCIGIVPEKRRMPSSTFVKL